ncbi:MAG: hypothetical protein JNM72_25745 [Deltaproteobacteria bacterium]|nr:hypothetical protein [Deltaproteobacteria bacterium]
MPPLANARGAPPLAAPLGLWDLLGAGMAAVSLALHLRFVLLDRRAPADPGLYLKRVGEALSALAARDLEALGALLAEVSGWYNVLVALSHTLSDGAPWGARLPTVGWFALILLTTGLIARRAGGPGLAAAAVGLCAGMPIVTLQARTLWIHVPEAALVLVGLALTQGDPRLRAPLRLGAVAACLGLTLSLRPSGLAWAPLIALPWWAGPRPRPAALLGLALVAALAAAPTLQGLGTYLTAKANARAGYVERMPFPELSGLLQLFGPALAISAASLMPAHSPLLHRFALAVLAQSALLWATFRAGFDNFTLLGPALALACASGLSRLGAAGPTLAALIWAAAVLPTHLKPPRGEDRGLTLGYATEIKDLHRPWQGYGAAEVEAIISATCGEAPCRIAVNQGIFEPGGEEPGRLGLTLLGLTELGLSDLRHGGGRRGVAPQLAVDWGCAVGTRGWEARFPKAAAAFDELVRTEGMLPLWSSYLRPDCAVRWWVHPSVEVQRGRMPTTGAVKLPDGHLAQPVAPRRPPPRRGPIRGQKDEGRP